AGDRSAVGRSAGGGAISPPAASALAGLHPPRASPSRRETKSGEAPGGPGGGLAGTGTAPAPLRGRDAPDGPGGIGGGGPDAVGHAVDHQGEPTGAVDRPGCGPRGGGGGGGCRGGGSGG